MNVESTDLLRKAGQTQRCLTIHGAVKERFTAKHGQCPCQGSQPLRPELRGTSLSPAYSGIQSETAVPDELGLLPQNGVASHRKYTRRTRVFGFQGAYIGVEGKAEKRRCSRTTASFSNAGIRVKVRAIKAENPCTAGITDQAYATCRDRQLL